MSIKLLFIYRFQFICDSYRKCKFGTVKEKDFTKLEDVLNTVYDQLLKRRNTNSLKKNSGDNDYLTPASPAGGAIKQNDNNNNNNFNYNNLRPQLNKIAKPICCICNKSFLSSHCFTTCSHPLCIKCIVNTFNHPPRVSKWYVFCSFVCNKSETIDII